MHLGKITPTLQMFDEVKAREFYAYRDDRAG